MGTVIQFELALDQHMRPVVPGSAAADDPGVQKIAVQTVSKVAFAVNDDNVVLREYVQLRRRLEAQGYDVIEVVRADWKNRRVSRGREIHNALFKCNNRRQLKAIR